MEHVPDQVPVPVQLPAQLKANPRSLLKRFVLYSIVAVAVILVLVGSGLDYIYRGQLIRSARENSVSVAEAIFEHERGVLVDTPPEAMARITIREEDFAGLDRRMRLFLRAFGMVKVKLYDADRKIVYSTDTLILGRVDAGNASLDRVLRMGEVNAHLEEKYRVTDLRGEERIGVDVVETYVPVRLGEAIIGCFEVYIDITPAYRSTSTVARASLTVLLVVLVVVFGILFVPMWQGTKRLAYVQDRLRDLAAVDVLTGLFNRRQLFVQIGAEYSRMERAGLRHEPRDCLGFVMVDIDHFKAINDDHGHQAGDEVLQQVSARLKGSLRSYDVIGRYGGEEFLVMLPHTKLDDAVIVAERMRRGIAATPLDIGGKTIRVTASFGVAQSRDVPGDMEAAVHRADQGLYRAKESGRDTVASVA